MKLKALVLATITAALIPALAQAKPDGERPECKGEHPNPEQIFKDLDTDESGSISQDEAADAKRLAEHFDEIDADGDGEITKQEFGQHMEAMKEKHKGEHGEKFKDIDSDGNGSISKDEAEAGDAKRLFEHFDHIDADGDGELSKEELRAAKPGGPKKRGPKPEADEDQAGRKI